MPGRGHRTPSPASRADRPARTSCGCDRAGHGRPSRSPSRRSATWQLVINTGTTIITFLMVFLIQNTQNRDSIAVQLKLAELVIAVKGAKNQMANIEDAS